MSYECVLNNGNECDGCQLCWDNEEDDGELEARQEDMDESEGRNGWPGFFK